MKKILALFAVLLVAFMVFACGTNATTTAAKTTGPAASTTTEAASTTTVDNKTTAGNQTTAGVTTTTPAETTTQAAVTTDPAATTTQAATTTPATPIVSADKTFTDAGYDLTKYTKLDLSPIAKSYYNSTSGTGLTASAEDGDTASKFWVNGALLSKADLPEGTVIVVSEGFQYRPEGWQKATEKNSGSRPGNVTTAITVVNDEWWGDFNYRAFNVASTASEVMTDAHFVVFGIYVPNKPVSGEYVDVDFADGKVTDKNGYASFANIGTPVVTNVKVKHNDVYRTVPALQVTSGNFVYGTFNRIKDEALMNEVLAEGFSIEVFYLDNSTDNAAVFCMTEGNKGYGIAHNKAKNQPYFITGNGSGYNSVYPATDAVISNEELVHVVGVYDATAKTHTIYINGVLSGTPTADVPAVLATSTTSKDGIAMFNTFGLGGDFSPKTDRVGDFLATDMTIVDAKFYFDVLTAEEAKAAYDASAAAFELKRGEVYVDVDFKDGKAVDTDYATFTTVGTPVIGTTTVKHNGATLDVEALKVTNKNGYLVGTFTELDTEEKMQAFLSAGFSVEAFYLDNSTGASAIVCMTENPSGWGIAHNSNKPYFITGNGNKTAPWNAAYSLATPSDEELVHVVAVYDPATATHTIYVNGVEVSKRDTANQPGTSVPTVDAIDATLKSKEGLYLFNAFCMGGDLAQASYNRVDFASTDLTLVDAKIYYGALTATEVAAAYTAAKVEYVADPAPEASSTEGLPTTPTVTGTFLAYVPVGNTAKAIELATGKVAGIIEAGTDVTIKGGYIYVAEVKDGKIIATKQVGQALTSTKMASGFTNKRSETNEVKPGAVNGGSWWNTVALKNFMINSIDGKTFNELVDPAIGKFGTITFTSIDDGGFGIYLDGDKDNSDFAESFKFNFVYFNYDGTDLKEATGTTWTPVGMNQMHIIREAMDKALGKESGYVNSMWQGYLDNYGAPGSVKRHGDVYTGKTYQDYYQNEFLAALVTDKYTGAVNNYKKLVFSDDSVKAILEHKDAVLAKAAKAVDDAVAANADIKALKDAMDAALAAYEAAQQTNYEAQVKYEVQKAIAGSSDPTAVELKVPYDAATKAMGEAKTAYETAKKAYDDAFNANAELVGLYGAYTAAVAEQKTAATNAGYVDAYYQWTETYEAFLAEYDKAANVKLWGADVATSALYNAFKDIEEDNRVYPTFTYYYDAVADTYTIFVNAAKDANMKASWK